MRWLMVLGFGVLACDPPTAPGPPSLEFKGQVVFGLRTLPTEAVGEPGGITVTGVIPTPTSGYTLFGELKDVNAREMTLEINATIDHEVVPFPVQNYYQGRIRNLRRGT